jgi:hypothetical protein
MFVSDRLPSDPPQTDEAWTLYDDCRHIQALIARLVLRKLIPQIPPEPED